MRRMHIWFVVMCSPSVLLADNKEDTLLQVAGLGTVNVRPDLAHVTLGVITQAVEASSTVEQNSLLMQQLMNALKKLGVNERDMQSVRLNLAPRYRRQRNPREEDPQIIGYQMTHTLKITVRKLPLLGKVMDQAVKSGANQITSVSFGVSDSEKRVDEARRRAIADARRKAALYAESADLKLGRMVSMSEPIRGPARGQESTLRMRAFSADASIPIASGEQQFSATIHVTYNLKP